MKDYEILNKKVSNAIKKLIAIKQDEINRLNAVKRLINVEEKVSILNKDIEFLRELKDNDGVAHTLPILIDHLKYAMDYDIDVTQHKLELIYLVLYEY